MHPGTTLVNDQLGAQFLFYNMFISFLYMFRATPCSSSGGQIVLIQHLVQSLSLSGRPVYRSRSYFSTCTPVGVTGQRVTIIGAVLIQFDLLMMSTVLLETCRGMKIYICANLVIYQVSNILYSERFKNNHVFKLLPCFNCNMFLFRKFPGV